ncbi:MAG: ABC transporter permease [Deltaproteobacteria bacterium]|nr:ABC transporter permease [Deltaproteobacteria bacterium]
MKSMTRIIAIATKEWRLNVRFPMEYFANNLVSPLKAAILMYFIYSGLLQRENSSLGLLSRDNFSIFVILGTTCHSLFTSSLFIFRQKLLNEKWWQTVTATLISPASTFEMIIGFIIGSGTLNIAVAVTLFSIIACFVPIHAEAFIISILVILLLAIFGFGMGLIGATFALCWEGKSFLFDYAIQAIVFLSCFYYPIETLPKVLHSGIELLPTYHAVRLVQELYLYGSSHNMMFALTYLLFSCAVAITLPTFIFERSVKKYGIIGY